MELFIEAAGNTLEAYINVPRMLPFLDIGLYNAIGWVRKTKDAINREGDGLP